MAARRDEKGSPDRDEEARDPEPGNDAPAGSDGRDGAGRLRGPVLCHGGGHSDSLGAGGTRELHLARVFEVCLPEPNVVRCRT